MTQPARALTIAGSDSGGGAGIQADLKTFQELRVFGMTAITAVTAQNTLGVFDVQTLPAEAVAKQLDAVATDIGVDATKTGMLANAEITSVVARKVKEHQLFPLVVDPVMVSTSGHLLLDQAARKQFMEELIPLATVITPNIPEAEALTETPLTDLNARKQAAQALHALGAQSVVIKGGHLEDDDAVDLFYDGKEFVFLRSPRFDTSHTHGTGCTLSAAIAAYLARGFTLANAVSQAKQFISAAISHAFPLGSGHGPTNHWAHRLGGELYAD
ncbi:bifunctional hydroxymethylpyrimidine kinase/phosphomethylpyrimidine kinase [Laceyella sacchari]|uniref:Hydroxymethylpyrimidine/phosphomethylpyrimidine kinase n=2 Tax=Laceyella TaxID=292635 RepID=A0AA45WJS2_9BACL|nr:MULTISPECIES: bifunctional hydroxymethylpyrimidine kinase/phosphomethylpyrimidine kinase [Laceyella]AUS08259.1 bifunctional hydroxymethylpyrimidine kinase/phosphomethylpyrimidine kinase [Laceyella sacchari]MRG26880.1 bifunctional hydroxymethylpyrimidine kinase/phosphomethylpyrimidine kinase [Laceyella tengchongensis]PRZ16020.1 hydroxymethylpyrimidine/phosphomethylpyrimidine kinase [Laceyella sediminis]SMP04524.1 hydroxymethylpyrimidine/phosphomethylpyrimidine kinase [Laceyella tengchongensis